MKKILSYLKANIKGNVNIFLTVFFVLWCAIMWVQLNSLDFYNISLPALFIKCFVGISFSGSGGMLILVAIDRINLGKTGVMKKTNELKKQKRA